MLTAAPEVEIEAPLSDQEREDFALLETTIADGLHQMEQAGKALIEIRTRKLYRGQFRTFKAYVEVKWSTSVRSAYQICGVAEVVENLRANGAQTLPESERQCRELSKVAPEEQPRVWQAANELGDTTARGIAEAVEIILPESAKARKKTTPPARTRAELNLPKPLRVFMSDHSEAEEQAGPRVIDVTTKITEASPPTCGNQLLGGATWQDLRVLWDATDDFHRLEFLRSIFGARPRREVQSAMSRAAKKK